VDPGKVCSLNTKVENNNGTLHLKRVLNIDALALELKYYGALRNFSESLRW
jgi:hypothetical protein